MTGRSRRRPAAPELLAPILVRWERVDRRRRHIRPARPGGLVGVELRRHRAPAVTLRDGVTVRRGDLVGELHLDSARVNAVVAVDGWFAIARARDDLAAVARWTARSDGDPRPVAYHASTLLGPLLARVGFETSPRPRTHRTRLDEWFQRWLMARSSAEGRARLVHGRNRLRATDAWLSAHALVALMATEADASVGHAAEHRLEPGRRPGR